MIYILFGVSGLTGLIYEIVWSRILSTVLGSSSVAIATILSIFMTGLAIGSLSSSRLKSQKPLRSYGALEGFIGIYSLLTLFLAKAIDAVYANWYHTLSDHFLASVGLKAFLSGLLLLPPSIAMGATLPLLVRLYRSPQSAGRFYSVNTAGAVLGTILAGYFLLPTIGITWTIYFAAFLNCAIAVIATVAGGPEEANRERTSVHFRPLFLLFLFTGFSVLSYEVLWTRALIMFFGSSVYSFTAIVVAFLLGIAAGSGYYARRIPESADAYQFYSLVQFRLSLAALFFAGIFMAMPFFLIRLFQIFYTSFTLFQIGQVILISGVVFYAAFLAGAAFPAALHFFKTAQDKTDVYTMYVYGYSTLGAILGSICAGFVLIPRLGVERSIRLIALLNLILGIFSFRKSPAAKQQKRVLMIGAAALFLLMLLPGWNRSIYNAGFYAFAYKYVSPARSGYHYPLLPNANLRLLYYSEGLTATVAVAEGNNRIRSLLINGKPEASNLPTGEMRTELLVGHLPLLLSKPAKDVLLIGLGSGITAGAVSTHQPQRIDCVEIERKVANAARYFDNESFAVLDNPCFHLIFDDGRNVIAHTRSRYDAIISEPSNLWISGVANLFTQEFFRAASSKLKAGGIFCQWIHLYQISEKDVFIFLSTFRSVFPHLSIWIDRSDMIVLGSQSPIPVTVDNLVQRAQEPAVARSLERCNLTPTNLIRCYLADETLSWNVDVPVNTDDHPILEFSAPKSLFFDRSHWIVQHLRQLSITAASEK